MDITLKDTSKKYNREYIFKNLSYTFKNGHSYALTGSNGSGKSTLIQVLSGYMRPTKGEIVYEHPTTHVDDVYEKISLATPYMELIEEFTLMELLQFHFQFKQPTHPIDHIVKIAYLEDAKHKAVKNFSSGMKQRLKLALSFFSEAAILLLDEPTSNLDAKGTEWYRDQLQNILKQRSRLVIIASNQNHEYDLCEEILNIEDYK